MWILVHDLNEIVVSLEELVVPVHEAGDWIRSPDWTQNEGEGEDHHQDSVELGVRCTCAPAAAAVRRSDRAVALEVLVRQPSEQDSACMEIRNQKNTHTARSEATPLTWESFKGGRIKHFSSSSQWSLWQQQTKYSQHYYYHHVF